MDNTILDLQRNGETLIATGHGFARYRLGPHGVKREYLCTFIARVVDIIEEEDGTHSVQILARCCRDGFEQRLVLFEMPEKHLQNPRNLDRALLQHGGCGFIMWPGLAAATLRAVLSCTAEEYADAENEIIARLSRRNA